MRPWALACLAGCVSVVLGLSASAGVHRGRDAPPKQAISEFLVIAVVDSGSRRPLQNAEVTDLSSGQHRFTDRDGQARISWPADGRLRLRVRQIGFQVSEREINRSVLMMASARTYTFSLRRVSYVLPPVIAKTTTSCAAPADSVSIRLSALVLDQLRAGAERYEMFRRSYPFQASVTRRTATLDKGGKLFRVVESEGKVKSDQWSAPYRPGRLIERKGWGFSIPILYLSALADPVFWDNHCFMARGVEPLEGSRAFRLDFTPGSSVRKADWAGSAFIDSTTSLLRRVEFRLVGLNEGEMPRRLEGYTTFSSPSPFIAIPDSTVAGWWRRPITGNDWGLPDVIQLLHVKGLNYRRDRPAQ